MGGHTLILSSGQQCSYAVKNTAAKYGKFAYSSAFGYSVQVGSGTLEELGADSALALSVDGGETWKLRIKTVEARIETSADGGTHWLRSLWYPWKDVEVETWLVAPQKDTPLWHLRVHRLKVGKGVRLTSAEGGWAIYGQREEDDRALEATSDATKFGTMEHGFEARVVSRAGVSGISSMEPGLWRTGKALRTDANTNLMVPRAVLPTIMDEFEGDGESSWFITAVFGLPSEAGAVGPKKGWEVDWETRPTVPKEIQALVDSK